MIDSSKSNKKTILIIVLVLIIGLIAVYFGYNKFKSANSTTNNNNQAAGNNDTNSTDKANTTTSSANPVALDIKSLQVTNLYNYLAQYNEYGSDQNDEFYQDKKVTYSDLDNAYRLYTAYGYLNDLALIKVKKISSCDEVKAYSNLYQLCNNADYQKDILNSQVGSQIYDASKTNLTQYYQIIFGADKELPKATFYYNYIECEYSSSTDDYMCYDTQTGGTGRPFIYNTIVNATDYGNKIEIEDHHVYCAITGDNFDQFSCYKDDKGTNLIKSYPNSGTIISEVEDSVKAAGQLYKHTFVKTDAGTYYWLSSEPIQE
jgi:hypothetical protein